MIIDEVHKSILRDIKTFAAIKRYRGMLPRKLAVFDDLKAMELVEEGLIELVSVAFSCGSEGRFYRLTKVGEAFLAGEMSVVHGRGDDREALELSKEALAMLEDIYHFSLIRRFGGMMPAEEVEHFDPKELNRLFVNGYIIRIKADMGKAGKRKGLILSEKGLQTVLSYPVDS